MIEPHGNIIQLRSLGKTANVRASFMHLEMRLYTTPAPALYERSSRSHSQLPAIHNSAAEQRRRLLVSQAQTPPTISSCTPMSSSCITSLRQAREQGFIQGPYPSSNIVGVDDRAWTNMGVRYSETVSLHALAFSCDYNTLCMVIRDEMTAMNMR
jgi:hypothetical protein